MPVAKRNLCSCGVQRREDGKCPYGCEAFAKPGLRRRQADRKLRDNEHKAKVEMSRLSIARPAAKAMAKIVAVSGMKNNW